MTGTSPEKKLLDLIKHTQGKLKLKKELKIFTKINIILIGLIVVILAVFFVDLFTSGYKIPELSVDLPQEEQVLPKLREFDEDVEDIDIVVEKDAPIPKEDLVKNLNLLGIITGDNNQAIIEDKTSKKTHFLYKGDSLGEFKIHGIKDSSVTLEYKGEEIELRM